MKVNLREIAENIRDELNPLSSKKLYVVANFFGASDSYPDRIVIEGIKNLKSTGKFTNDDILQIRTAIKKHFSSKTLDIKENLSDRAMYIAVITVKDTANETELSEAADDRQIDESAFLHDETDHPIVTVGDLKKVLSNFKDYDKINVCDDEGIPNYKIVAMWNTEYERSMVADPNDVDDNTCYIRIGRI